MKMGGQAFLPDLSRRPAGCFGFTKGNNCEKGSQVKLPRIAVGELEVSRLIVGGNPFSAISHQTAERDKEMRDYYTTERIKQTLRECEDAGINTFCGRADNHVMRLLNEYWNEGGRIQWLAQTAPERLSLEQNIRQAARAGAKAIYIQGGTVDQAMEDALLEELREPLELIHSLGCVAGIAGHNPETHRTAEEIGLPTDLHMVCFYNLTGRRGKIDVADPSEGYHPDDPAKAAEVIQELPKPCFAYKVLAAGRRNPREALAYAFENIKPTDAVVVGVYTKDRPSEVVDNARTVLELLGQEVPR